MNDYDKSYMMFLAGMIINCCWNNPWAALAGALATFIGGAGMILWRKQDQ